MGGRAAERESTGRALGSLQLHHQGGQHEMGEGGWKMGSAHGTPPYRCGSSLQRGGHLPKHP